MAEARDFDRLMKFERVLSIYNLHRAAIAVRSCDSLDFTLYERAASWRHLRMFGVLGRDAVDVTLRRVDHRKAFRLLRGR